MLLRSLLCLLLALPVFAHARTPAPTPQAKAAQAVLTKMAPHYPGLSATVYVRGRKVWTGVTGQADMAAGEPVTEATRFTLYSTSKALIGMAFARLIETNRVRLDTTAGEIDPTLPAAFHSIRLRDILSHTSGIRHYNSPADWLAFARLTCTSPAQALAYFRDDPLVSAPGTKEHYSSFAFVLASHLLVRITGADEFEQALNTALGPWAAFQLDTPVSVRATPYIRAKDLPVLPAKAAPEDILPSPLPPATCKYGGGGLMASSSELAQAGAMFASGQIIPKGKLKAALKSWSDVSGIVYGGGIKTLRRGGKDILTYSLSGGAPGGRSYLLVLIEPQIAVAITGNIDGPNLADTALEIARLW